MTRHEELAAQATRVQVRPGGLVTDYLGCGPTVRERYGDVDLGPDVQGSARLALVRCVHGNEWPEGGAADEGTCSRCLAGLDAWPDDDNPAAE